MHILAGLLAAIGVVIAILWRLHMASEAAKGIAETAGDLRGYLRRRSWQKKLVSNRLDLVDDPRVAATAMMVALAQSDGALTQREETEITSQAAAKFQINQETAAELQAHARWLIGEIQNSDDCFHRLAPIIEKGCDAEQRAELFEMLQAVAAHAPPASAESIAKTITNLQNRLA